jgi:hypothetical protein
MNTTKQDKGALWLKVAENRGLPDEKKIEQLSAGQHFAAAIWLVAYPMGAGYWWRCYLSDWAERAGLVCVFVYAKGYSLPYTAASEPGKQLFRPGRLTHQILFRHVTIMT